MSSPSKFYILRLFLRPITATPPPAFGPLALAHELLKQSPNLNLRIEYVDGQTGIGKDKSCMILDNTDTSLAIDSLESLKFLSTQFQNSNPGGDSHLQSIPTITTKNEQIDLVFQIIAGIFDPKTFKDLNTITEIFNKIDDRLILRTFLVGHTLSVLDWALWGFIKSSSTANALLKRSQHLNLTRWFNYLENQSSSSKSISELQEQIKNSIKSRSKAGVASLNFDEGLPGAIKGQVVTRFPPEPSGYLHIGHCKAAILNQHYAKTYQGQFIVRFDDTNPSKEKGEFQDAILEDLKLLGIEGDKMSYTSDYFDKLYDYALMIIQSGKAFCDDTEQEVMKAERMARQPSKRRDATVEENLARFEEMCKGTTEGLRWCLRAKIRFDDLNGTLRDPVIYRCNLLPHHRTGEKCKVYPTYDFACPIVDSIEGVTHALRTNEYRDRNPQYWWMQEALGLRKVAIKDFARVNFVYTLLSKRKLKWFVDTGKVRGWDDPRFATVRGIRRRGMTIQALRDFMISQGDSQQQVNMEWDVLWSINKRIIDLIVPRHTVIQTKDRVISRIRGGPDEAYVQSLPTHKKNAELGMKQVIFSSEIYLEQEDANSFEVDEEITLMDWGNAIVRVKETDGVVRSLELELHLEGDFKKTKKKVHWLTSSVDGTNLSSSSSSTSGQDVVLLDYDYLIKKRKVEEEDEIEDLMTSVSEFVEYGVADGNISKMKKGDMLQFERKGYYIVDKPVGVESSLDGSGVSWMELIRIPDGRAAGIASKATPTESSGVVEDENKKNKIKKKNKKGSEPIIGSGSTMYRVDAIDGCSTEQDGGGDRSSPVGMYKVSNIYE